MRRKGNSSVFLGQFLHVDFGIARGELGVGKEH
jgi:hypothetical protein